jgi:hypothetical protein
MVSGLLSTWEGNVLELFLLSRKPFDGMGDDSLDIEVVVRSFFGGAVPSATMSISSGGNLDGPASEQSASTVCGTHSESSNSDIGCQSSAAPS